MNKRVICLAGLLTLLSGCTTVDFKAPIEDRSVGATGTAPVARPAESVPVPVVQPEGSHLVAERQAVASGRTHTVVAGDTLYNIGVRYHVNPRELGKMNGIDNPAALPLGAVLQIPENGEMAAPAAVEVPAEQTAPAEAQSVEVTGAAIPVPATVTAAPAAEEKDTGPAVEVAERPLSAEEIARKEIAAQESARRAAASGEMKFRWPVSGPVISTFADNKLGIDIGGSMGEPVMCVLDGTVQYVGNNAKGYGQFVIVRHNVRLPGPGTMPLITVYGNTSKILVRINESVRAGQKIAEMGNSDSEDGRVKLRFEVRQGTPMDPMKYLQK